jgi:hypothetical protein
VIAGKVDPTTLAVTLYPPSALLEDPTSSYYFAIVGMTDASYITVYHNSSQKVDEYYGYDALQAKVATVDKTTGVVTVGPAAQLPDSTPIFSLAATRLSASSAVVVYADYESDYAIRAQEVKIYLENDPPTIGKYRPATN